MIPILKNPSGREFLQASRGLRHPVVVASTDDAPNLLTLDGLDALIGDETVRVEYYPDGSGSNSWEHRTMPISKYVEVQQGPEARNWFLAEQPLRTMFSEVSDVIRVPGLLAEAGVHEFSSESVFAGVTTTSVLHLHDRDQALLMQMGGTKRIIMAGPECTTALKPPWFWASRSNYSSLELPGDPDEAKAVMEAEVGHPLDIVDLEAGQMLFIPVQWWHWAHGLGESVSYTLFWRSSVKEWAFPQPGIRSGAGIAAQGVRVKLRDVATKAGKTDAALNVAAKLGVVRDPEAFKARLPID